MKTKNDSPNGEREDAPDEITESAYDFCPATFFEPPLTTEEEEQEYRADVARAFGEAEAAKWFQDHPVTPRRKRPS